MKRKSIKRLFCLLLALMMALAVAACGGSKNGDGGATAPTTAPTAAPAADSGATTESNTATESSATAESSSTADSGAITDSSVAAEGQGTWRTDTTPITFSLYYAQDWGATDWSNDPNTCTGYIVELTGVDLDITTGPDMEPLNLMMASGDYPDLLMTWGRDFKPVLEMIADGALWSVTELADLYDRTFYDNVSQASIKNMSAADGKLYDYVNFSASPELAVEALAKGPDNWREIKEFWSFSVPLVRNDMYHALTAQAPLDLTTPEGFLDALRRAKEMFPTIDGMPMYTVDFGTDTGLIFWHMKDFLGIPLLDENGIWNDHNTHPETLRWLRCWRQAYQEGLISDDVFTDGNAQRQEKYANGQYFFALGGANDVLGWSQSLYDATGKDEASSVYYIPVDAIRSSANTKPLLQCANTNPGTWMSTFITKSCKDPARAIRFMNFIMGEEGQHALRFGREGTNFEYKNGEEFDILNEDGNQVGAFSWQWIWNTPKFRLQFPSGHGSDIPFEPRDAAVKWSIPYLYVTPESEGLYVDGTKYPDLEVKSKLLADAYNEMRARLIRAASDAEFDAIVDEYIALRESQYDYSEIVKVYTEMVKDKRMMIWGTINR